MREVTAEVEAGRLGPAMALVRLLVRRPDVDALAALLSAAEGPAAASLLQTMAAHRAGLDRAAAILRKTPHDQAFASPDEGVAACAALFDRAAATDPAAAVALHSLGDPGLLAEATAELVDLMRRLGLLGPGCRLLDLGCGTGRVTLAVAPAVARAVGIDVSPAMIARAEAAARGVRNVAFRLTRGRDLAEFGDGSFETVVAVDSFPYLHQAGGPAFVRTQCHEIARVLALGGALLVLNLSYRGDPAADRAEAEAIAAETGLALLRNGTRDLRTWDGVTFFWRKAG